MQLSMASNPLTLNESHLLDELVLGHDGIHDAIEVAANPYNRIDVISDIDDFLALREPWNQMNDESSNGTVFNSWEWMYTWWETYRKQSNRSLYILKCTNIHNELLGIAPFQIVHNPKKYFPCSRQLLMLGTGETDGSLVFGEYTDLAIKKGHETAVISALSDFLSLQCGLWDGIKFQQQLKGSHLAKLFEIPKHQTARYAGKYSIQKTVAEDGFRTYIDLPNTYKDYLMSLRKKMRNNITRTFSRLESEQDYTISKVTTDSEIEAQIAGKDSAIDILAKLNKTRRDDLAKNSVFEKGQFEVFHRRLLKRLLPLNKVSLRVLKFADEPVAALYCFIDNNTVHAYQSGFETENGHRYSLLTTMLSQEIANSIEDENITRFNFMYSDDEGTYKKRYSGNTEKMYNISYDKQGMKFSLYSVIHGPIKNIVKRLCNIS